MTYIISMNYENVESSVLSIASYMQMVSKIGVIGNTSYQYGSVRQVMNKLVKAQGILANISAFGADLNKLLDDVSNDVSALEAKDRLRVASATSTTNDKQS